jgi:hypothetical protein
MKIFFSFLLGLGALTACAPESVEKYHTGETEEQVMSLFNQREYHKAIFLIESREGEYPSGKMGYLLAQAYLGKAGLEPLEFAAKIFGEIPASQELFFPKCERGAQRNLELSEKCLLQRVYLFAPAPDSKEMQRARALFRKAYPSARDTPPWVNALIGMVELISFTKRTGNLYFYAMGKSALTYTQADLPWLETQAKNGFQEARFTLERAEHSGEKISKLLGAKEKNLWFQRAEGTVDFTNAMGLRRFYDFLRENLVKPTDEIRYGDALDRLKKILETENTL